MTDSAERVRSGLGSGSTPRRTSSTRGAILNADRLFEEASKLITPPAGRPRQVDVRRAILRLYAAKRATLFRRFPFAELCARHISAALSNWLRPPLLWGLT